jgi:hypothetical protein
MHVDALSKQAPARHAIECLLGESFDIGAERRPSVAEVAGCARALVADCMSLLVT